MGLKKPAYTRSELPGGGRKLPLNERLHLSTDQQWIESQGHLSDLIRLQWTADRAKPALVWVDQAGKDKAAIITHDMANDPATPDHEHISIETTMSPTGATPDQLYTRMEFPYDQDVCEIQTHSSNFTVRDGENRVSAGPGSWKSFAVGLWDNVADVFKSRWAFRGNSTAETGGNVGSDFEITRYNDAGTALDSPFFIKRSNAYVGIGTKTPDVPFDVNANSIRVRTAKTPATATAAGKAGEIAWDANYVYVCVADNSWKRAALAAW